MLSTASTDKTVRLGDVLDRLGAQVFASDDELVAIPDAVDLRIREEIAVRWNMPVGDVTVRWGALPRVGQVNEQTSYRLVGRGTDSWFAVVFRNAGEPGTAVRLRAGVEERVPVATTRLSAGAVIGEADIAYRRVTHWGPVEADPTRSVEPGWRVVRDLNPGEPLVPPDVVPERLVQQGDAIRLRWKRGVVRVALDGTALHDAASGERVAVRLRNGRGVTAGIVTGPGEAALDG